MSEKNKLVKLTEKPKWFDMVDYEAIDKFDISSWTLNLKIRMIYSNTLNYIAPSDLNKLLHKEYELKPSYYSAIKFRTSQDLFYDFETMDKEFQTHFLGEFDNYLKKRDYPLQKGPGMLAYGNSFWSFCDVGSKYFKDKYKIFDNSFMINSFEHPCIKINTNLPKERIMKDFGNWLNEYKKQGTSNSIPFSEDVHRKLCDNRYLQIIDLLNYARIKNFWITNANLMSWVFPDESKDTSRITQLKKEIKEKILTPNYIEWLESQIE